MGVNISGSGILSGIASLVMGAVNSLNLLVTRIIGYTTSSGGGSSYYTTMVGSTGPGYVLAKNDGVYYSTDLENISTTKALDTWGISEILEVNGIFFTNGLQSPYTSSDGVNWSPIAASQSYLDSRFRLTGAFYIDNKYTLVGNTREGDGTVESPYVYRGMSLKSTDGVNWDWHLQVPGLYISSVVHQTSEISETSQLVAIFVNSNNNRIIKYSNEGYYWYDLELSVSNPAGPYTGPIPSKVIIDNWGIVFAVSGSESISNGEYIGRKQPNSTQMFFYEPSENYVGLTSISFHENGQYYFAVNASSPGKIFTSNDSVEWVETSLPSPLEPVTFDKTKFLNGLPIVYGTYGLLVISRDPNTGLVTVDLSNIFDDFTDNEPGPQLTEVLYHNNKWIAASFDYGIATGTSIFNLQYKNNTAGFFDITAGTVSTLVEAQVSIGDQGTEGAEILAPVDVYTAPAEETYLSAFIQEVKLKNLSNNTITYDLGLLSPGVDLSDQNALINDQPILAGQTITLTDQDIPGPIINGTRIVILPSSVDVLEVKVYGFEQ